MSLSAPPDPLAATRSPTSKGKGREGRGRKGKELEGRGKGRGGKGRGGEGKEVEGKKERREGVGRGRTPHFVNPGSAPENFGGMFQRKQI